MDLGEKNCRSTLSVHTINQSYCFQRKQRIYNYLRPKLAIAFYSFIKITIRIILNLISNVALTIYTAYLYGPSRETQRVSSVL